MDRAERGGQAADEDRAEVDGESDAESPGASGSPGAPGTDDPTDPDLAPPAAPTLGRVPPVNRVMARLENRLGGRPIAVYGVLLAGGLVLLILLMIVWFSAGGGDDDDPPICTETSPANAVALIKDGEVDRISIDSPRSDDSAIDGEIVLPALLRLGLADGNCRNLEPQGPLGEIEMYTVLGAVEWYNHKTQQRRIEIDINENDSIPAEVLATVTPTPAPTVPATETPVDAATPVPDTPTATPEPTATPTIPAPVDASPAASPAASPVASPAA